MLEPRKEPVRPEKFHFLLHPYNALLVTSRGKNEKTNVMTVSWIIPVSGNPPLLAMSIRPERYSHEFIMETKEFVVNIPTFELAKKVLLCGRRSGKNFEKFKGASLSTQEARKVGVPIVRECIAHLECKLEKTERIGDHTLIIGLVVAAYAVDGYFREIYNVKKHQPCLYLGKNLFTTCLKKTVRPEI